MHSARSYLCNQSQSLVTLSMHFPQVSQLHLTQLKIAFHKMCLLPPCLWRLSRMMTPCLIPQACLDSESNILQLVPTVRTVTLLPSPWHVFPQAHHNLLLHFVPTVRTVTLLPSPWHMFPQAHHNLLLHCCSNELLSMSLHTLAHCNMATRSILDLLST